MPTRDTIFGFLWRIMRRLFHSVTLSPTDVTSLSTSFLLLTRSFSRSLSLSLFLTVAPSPIKPSTKLPARFPEKPTTHSLSRLRINVFFFNRYLFPLPSSLSLYSSRSCAVLRQTRCVEFYCAHDCSRLNKTDRKTRSECVPHFRQSSRIFLISSRSLNIIFRDVFVPFLHSVFSFFFPSFSLTRRRAVKICVASRSCV